MDLTPHVAALRDDLAAAAAVGDEATSRAGSTLAAALEPAVRLALMNALSDLAAEIDAGLDDHSVSLRLRGREVDVVIDRAAGPDADDPEPDPGGFFAGPSSSPFAAPGAGRFEKPGHPGHPGHPGFPGHPFPGRPGAGPDVGDISRMTLRIVDQIKGQAERAAAAQGMSLNSWVSQAVQGALRGQGNWAEGWHQGFGWDRPDDGPGADRPGADRPSTDRPSTDRPSTDRPSTDRPSSETSETGTPEGRSGDRRDDGDDGPGDGGVHGWVRG